MESEQSLGQLIDRVSRLESDLGARVAALEGQVAALVATTGSAATAHAHPLPPPPPPTPDMQPSASQPPPPSTPSIPSAQPLPPARAARRPGLVTEIGVEALLRWAGIVLVGLAAAFLVSTAVQRGWIGPELQLLGATAIGGGLLLSARHLAGRRRNWALALATGGAAVLIVCAGAGYRWLDLYDPVTGLVLVGVAAAIAVWAAIDLRMEAVAVTATAAMLVVPTWARIVADGPVPATGVWLVAFAIGATVVGVDRRWVLYRVVSTWAVAAWTLGLAGILASRDDTRYLVPAMTLVAVVTAILWLNPSLSRASGSSRRPWVTTVLGYEHRLTALVPLWTWSAVLAFADLDPRSPGGWIGVTLAGGFAVVALVAGPLERLIPGEVVASHLLGVGALVTVSAVAWLDGPTLVVVLASQALVTLVIAFRSTDILLRLNAYGLAAASWLVLGVGLLDAAELDRIVTGPTMAHAAVVVMLAAFAWLMAGHERRSLVDLANGLVWVAGLGFVAALLAPSTEGRPWLAVATVMAIAGLLAGRRLGPYVLAVGATLALGTVTAGGFSILGAAVEGADLVGHLSNLAVVAGLAIVTAGVWRYRPGDGVRPLFVITWIWSLGWLASVLVAGPQGQAAVSATWAVAACGAIVVGIRWNESMVGAVGLVTLGVTLAKLLTVDLAAVDTLWRVGLFLVVGLGLLRLGYVLPTLTRRAGPEVAQPGPAGAGTGTG